MPSFPLTSIGRDRGSRTSRGHSLARGQPQISVRLAARRTAGKRPGVAEDAFHPRLRTHKLKGKLKGSWACSARYDLRIVFRFVQYEEAEAVLLETVGTHEEVY